MADEITKNLLDIWGFSQYISAFEEQDITEEVLLSLNEINLIEILPTIGKRVLLMKKINEYKEDNKKIENLMNEEIIIVPPKSATLYDNLVPVVEQPSPSTSRSTSSNFSDELTLDEAKAIKRAYQETTTPLRSFYGETEFKKACLNSYHLNLRQFLEKSRSGQYILNTYNEKKTLSKKARNLLAEIIINGIIFDSNKTASNKDFEIITEKICQLFPSECPSTWYIPAISAKVAPTKKAINSKGKLPDKYKNLKKIYSQDKAKDEQLGLNEEDNEDSPEYSAEDIETSKTWLKHHVHPWDEVEKHWEILYKVRRNDKSRNLSEFISKWPILRNSHAYVLIENDFSKLYKDSVDKLYKNWQKFYDNLKNIENEQQNEILLQILPDSDDASSDALKILSLSSFLPPTSRIRKDKQHWKPSTVECQNSIIQHVKIAADIEDRIIKTKNAMNRLSLPVQPFIIVLGPNLMNIHESYLIIEDIIYKANSVLHAFDLCFKSFHVLHTHYPPESEHIWQIVQRYVYEFDTKWDKKIPTVERILKTLKESNVNNN